MILKLTVVGSAHDRADLIAELGADATIGMLAEALIPRDAGRADGVTLAIGNGVGSGPVPADTLVAESGLCSGATVRLVGASPPTVVAGGSGAVAVLRVLDGPDAGREFPLPAGATMVGRNPGGAVALTDPTVSKRHARIVVGDTVEIVDTNSVQGIVVGDGVVGRARLRATDTALLGDTLIAVRVLDPARAATGHTLARLQFNRCPRLDPVYPGSSFTLPTPPTRPTPYHFPMISVTIPLVVALGIYLITGQTGWLWFLLLSPVLLVGTYFEERLGARKSLKLATADFRTALAELDERLTDARADERAHRLAEHPSTMDVLAAVAEHGRLMWTRRPADQAFLDVRLALATQRSRHRVDADDTSGIPTLRAEVREVLNRHATVDAVPVVGALRACGALGVAGREDVAAGVARALVAQLAGLHSPAEVVVAAVASSASFLHWEWLKWLPHTTSPHSPLSGTHLARGLASCNAVVAELEQLAVTRQTEGDGQLLPAVVLLVEDDAPVERSRLVALADHGPACGVFVLWVAAAVEDLPAACRTFLDVTGPWSEAGSGATSGQPTGSAGYLHTGEAVEPVLADWIPVDLAANTARQLSPVVDASIAVTEDTDLPNSVSFLSRAGTELAHSPQAVIDEWSAGQPPASGDGSRRRRFRPSLRALVGEAGGEAFHLDLVEQGPHALVGGTTGAGKSELLQSWILGMATRYSPRRVTFLLVDYKGGAAFGDCERLPHCVGMVTDLNTHLVRRALVSLNAELRHREHVLNRYRAKDLSELEQDGCADTPPRLVIIVDEFAALVSEVPEFVDGMVNVAQRGRSLGLHLILATQRPAGVIKDNLRANTNLRVALRMADEEDSVDVLGTKQASSFDPAIPGRAVARLGGGRQVSFQTAYAGGWTSLQPEQPEIVIRGLPFGPGERWTRPEPPAGPRTVEDRPTDIRRIVTTVTDAAEVLQLAPPRKPWLPPLEPTYDLAALRDQAKPTDLVFGVCDLPEQQLQRPVRFDADRHGNLSVYGAGGSGRTTLLRTLAVTAGLVAEHDPSHVYGIDFGARGLQVLIDLPHVGGVLVGDDRERLDRLFHRLRDLIDNRAKLWAEVGAGSLVEYRALVREPTEPRVLVLVDGMSAFRETYETMPHSNTFATFIGIATDGRQFGVHVVVTADRASAVPSSLAAVLQHRIVLRMSDDDPMETGRTVSAASPPGRGLLDGDEIQVAILGGSPSTLDQANAISALTADLVRRRTLPAPDVQSLASLITLTELPASTSDSPIIGVASDTLEPVGLPRNGPFLITGPSGAGRTTALHTIATAVRRTRPSTDILFVGTRNTATLDPHLWSVAATTDEEIAAAVATRLAMCRSGALELAMFVESVPDYDCSDLEPALMALIKAYLDSGHLVICEGNRDNIRTGDLAKLAGTGRTGIALQPDSGDEHIFGTDFPRVRSRDFPPGRGMLVVRGIPSIVQLARVGE